jgi:hypothetical protein
MAKEGRGYIWQREAQRVSLALPIRWGADESCLHRGVLTSLSAKGALIEGPVALLPHASLYLLLPDGAGGHLLIVSEVVYFVEGAGVAVQFTELPEAQRAALVKVVEHHRSAP